MLISASPTRSSNPLIILAGGSYEEASSVARSLREIGYSCVCSPDYRTFEQHARLVKPDLLLLDSDIHGEFLRDGKRWEEFQSVPMIHLVSSAAERENAFAAGAVDCVVKPVLTEELLARVKGRLDLQQAQKQLDQRNMQFATTLENIGQGVCFFRRGPAADSIKSAVCGGIRPTTGDDQAGHDFKRDHRTALCGRCLPGRAA